MKNQPNEPSLTLQRFIDAQKHVYERAYSEIEQGRKKSHWMWFIFPQIAGLGQSERSIFYALKNLQEAEFYLQHPILGPRLIRICELLLKHDDFTAHKIFGSPDDQKLFSSMTLFSQIPNTSPVFGHVLLKYFQGKADFLTLNLIKQLRY